VNKYLILFIPFLLGAENLSYLDFEMIDIENAPIALPVDFFPEEDPFEGVIKPALKVFAPEFEELVKIHELSIEYKKNLLKGDPYFGELDELASEKEAVNKLADIEKVYPTGDPENFKIFLKKGVQVFDKKFNYTKTIYRDIYVNAVREYPTAPFFKILDKLGHARYEANAEDVVYLNETIDLKPRPKTYEIQISSPKAAAYDQKSNLEHSISIGAENFTANYFSLIADNPNTDDASAFRLDYELYHLWDFPVNFGLLLSYEYGTWDPGWTWNSMYFGLGIKVPWKLATWISLEGQVNWQTSMFFSFKGEASYKLSNNFIGISAEVVFKTGFGTYFISASYKKIFWSANDQAINVPSDLRSTNATGLGIGVKFSSLVSL